MEGLKAMNKLEVLYEDNHIVVVLKPANVLSQSDITEDLDMLNIVKQYVKKKYQKPGNVYIGLVHRLDRPVGGIMVFARTSKAAARLSDSIRNHTFRKKYLAVVHGILLEKSGTLIDDLEKRVDGMTQVVDDGKGKKSILHYRVLKEDQNTSLSLLEIELETGRHHQIRVQFASRGYPLYGDHRYGKSEQGTIALFAYDLSFPHPVREEICHFTRLPEPYGAWKGLL